MSDAFEIQIENVSKNFGDQPILGDVNFGIRKGEFLSIVGPSGCGKSTLLRMIAGLEQPTTGKIKINRKANHKQQIAFVFQEANLLPWLNAFENVALPFRITKQAVDAHLVAETLELVGIEKQDFKKLPKQLSGGMKMRVSIARALVLRPKILLLDEPFAALDDLLRTQLDQELVKIWGRDQLTVLFVTHNISEAIFISQKVAVMQTGPGRIRQTIDIPFAIPRENQIKTTTDFAKCFATVSAALEGVANSARDPQKTDQTQNDGTRSPANSGGASNSIGELP